MTTDAGRRNTPLWVAAVILVSLVPVRGVFTTDRLFFVRDLGLFFWSRHLWLRHTLFSGTLPLWDPYLASGHSAAADALNQIWMPLTLAVRLLPSDVISFNLWVALPVPLAAFGTWLFLRRSLDAPSAAFGATAFGLSGVLVGSLNAPNLSWSLAGLPYLCWAADRVASRPCLQSAASFAIVFALQTLCGEPVTLAASALAAAAYGLARAGDQPAGTMDRVARGNVLAWLATGFGVGVLLSAVQMLPTLLASLAADRASWSDAPDFWSLHPLSLIETIAPHLFGNYYTAFLADLPWMTRLNSGREPFFYSLYLGPLVLLVAACATRRARVWWVLAAAMTLAAMGSHTPAYPLVRRVLPPLEFFRFPVKYFAIASFAFAVLAADGWAAVRQASDRRRAQRVAAVAAGVSAILLGVVIVALLEVPVSLSFATRFADYLHVDNPAAAGRFLLREGAPAAARGLGLLLAGGALLSIAIGTSRRAVIARALLFALCLADLLIAGAGLNPTAAAMHLQPPEWYTALASPARVYIGGRSRGFMDASDPDGSHAWKFPPAASAIEGRARLNAELPMMPSGWRVREAVSYDLPVLLPAPYGDAMRRFLHSNGAERSAFLRRSAVRWCVLPDTAPVAAPPIADVPDWHMIARDCVPAAARVFIAADAEVAPDPLAQQNALFDPALDDGVLRVDREVSAGGRDGESRPTAVRISEDAPNRVVVEAELPQDGYVVLRDAYAAGWTASVDGQAAEIARANALYRAVRVRRGVHVIRFEYRPRAVAIGLTLTVSTALLLVGALVRGRSRARRSAGFTLVELMIVMAIIGILLALAFARYQGMQAHANEASAYASLRAITAAQATFAHTCGNEKFATTLPALAQPAPATGHGFLSPDLTYAEQVEHSGYLFQMTAKPSEGASQACSGVPVADGYAVTADPARPGRSGLRFFAVNADGTVYADEKDTFTGNMPESGPPGHGAEVKQMP